MIESQDFANKEKIAAKMEQEYLSLYFGVNKQIQSFAKELIIDNHRDAARELNKAVTVLGKGIEAERVIEHIKSEFDLHPKQNENQNNKEDDLIDIVVFYLGLPVAIFMFFIMLLFYFASY